ncbi:MAG: pre-peptidase C-terminal domain-containing protein [Pleurocapsa minor GSE-CHR-MK-17-07R]|nr:pre-peptidase C-terminal domain-containing protein [Pleurocapsa minor GSE-CHR-MK 17-07R]
MSTSQQLQQAFQLIKAGNKTDAAKLLVPIVRNEPNNADAWWLLSNAVTNVEQQRRALEKVLSLRPDDDRARRKLAQVTGAPPPESIAPTVMLPKSDMLAPKSDPFAQSAYGGDDPFAGMGSSSAGYTQDPFAPASSAPQPRRSGPPMASAPMMQQQRRGRSFGCNCCLVFVVLFLVASLACVGVLLFAGSQVANWLGATSINDVPSVFLGTATARPGSPMDQLLRQAGITDGNVGALVGTAEALGTSVGGDFAGAAATAQAALGGLQGLSGDALATAQAALGGVNGDALATAQAALGGADAQALVLTAQAALGGSGLDLSAISSALSTANIGDAYPEGVFTDRGSIAVGQEATGTVNQSGGDVYRFNGSAGQVLVINVTSSANSSLDGYLRVYGPDNTLVAYDDDGAGYPNAELTFTLPANGNYLFVVTSFAGSSSGEYTLAVAQGE